MHEKGSMVVLVAATRKRRLESNNQQALFTSDPSQALPQHPENIKHSTGIVQNMSILLKNMG